VTTTEARGAAQVVCAQVPMAEMLEYSSALVSITGGTGQFSMQFSHYDEAPVPVREKLVAAAKARAANAHGHERGG
jgi:elongation factor G